MDFNLTLTSITKTITKPSLSEDPGAEPVKETVTYRKGDPEFDQYVSSLSKEPAGPTLPKNFMGPTAIGTTCFGDDLFHTIDDVFDRYYLGLSGLAEIEAAISHAVSDMRSSYVSMGFDPAEFMPQLIEDVYSAARMANISGAGSGSWNEGRAIARPHNGSTEISRDWVYYDSKYYYASEDMKVKLVEIAQKLGQDYGISDLNLPTSYPDGDVRKGIYESYTTHINFRMRNDCHFGNFLDESVVPPRDFRFFYMAGSGRDPFVARLPAPIQEPEATFDAFLSIQCGNWSFTGRVPVRMDPTRFPVSVNTYDLISKSTAIPENVSEMLKNLDFFSPNLMGIYLPKHPRNY